MIGELVQIQSDGNFHRSFEHTECQLIEFMHIFEHRHFCAGPRRGASEHYRRRVARRDPVIVEAFTYIFDVLAGRLLWFRAGAFGSVALSRSSGVMPARACWAGPSVKVLRLLREPTLGAGQDALKAIALAMATKTRLEHGGAWNFARRVSYLFCEADRHVCLFLADISGCVDYRRRHPRSAASGEIHQLAASCMEFWFPLELSW